MIDVAADQLLERDAVWAAEVREPMAEAAQYAGDHNVPVAGHVDRSTIIRADRDAAGRL